MLQRSVLLCCLAASASAVVMYRCGGQAGRLEPCEYRDRNCDVECHSSEFCKKRHGDNWRCSTEKNRGCCIELYHWNKNRTLGCEEAECNSNEYCDTVKAGSLCVNGCCVDPEQKEQYSRASRPQTYFKGYFCGGKKHDTPCGRKACLQECHTTPYCQKVNGPGFFCTIYSHCCIEDDALNHLEEQRNCETFECNSHAYCRSVQPGSSCSDGCCVNPIKAISPPVVTEVTEATESPAESTQAPEATEAPESTKAPEATDAPESKKAPEATDESTKAPEEQRKCEVLECNSDDICREKLPGSHCSEGCCVANQDPLREGIEGRLIISPPVELKKATEGADATEAPEPTKATEGSEAAESTKAPEATDESAKAQDATEESTKAQDATEESTKAPETTDAPAPAQKLDATEAA